MKKSGLVALLILTVCCVALTACSHPTVKSPTDEERLISLLDSFFDGDSYATDGKIIKNHTDISTVSVKNDRTDKYLEITENDDTYVYYGTFLMARGETATIKKSGTTYAEMLHTYLPFSLHSFEYDSDYRGDLYITDDKIIITFLNKGVKVLFGSNLSVNGGVLVISFDEDGIVGSTLTTELTENGTTVSLYADYEYRKCEDTEVSWETMPYVEPTDTLAYAQYAMSMLAQKNSGRTLKSVAGKKDTGVSLGAFATSSDVVSNVSTIAIEDYVTLIIEYSEKQILVGLSSSVEILRITYDRSYDVSGVNINEGTKFSLE